MQEPGRAWSQGPIRSELVAERLVEQNLWLVKLRWMAAGIVLAAGFVGTELFPIMLAAVPFYVCGAILLAVNTALRLAGRRLAMSRPRALWLAMVQIEFDLVMLTVLVHFSGGVLNPCVLFYLFHVILAQIILPQTFAYVVGLSAVSLYGMMAFVEMHGLGPLVHHPLQLAAAGALWRNPVYVLWSFAVFAGTVMLAQYLTRTVTRRMRLKELEALRHRDILQAVIDSMAEGLIFVTNSLEVAVCNDTARRWCRESGPGDARPMRLDDLPRELAGFLRDRAGKDSPGAPEVLHLDEANQNGRYVEAKCAVVHGAGQAPLGHVIVGEDLTEHKQLEENLRRQSQEVVRMNEVLRRSQREMAQREKLAALGQLASGVAHEIGNPLASLLAVVEFLKRRNRDEVVDEHLMMMKGEIDRISGILRRLLELSRPAGNECVWYSPDEVIRNTIALVRYDKAAAGVRFELPEGPAPTIWGNKQHFEQVLLNVLLNAIAATAGNDEHKDKVLAVELRRQDHLLEVLIRDTGSGMTESVRQRAFEPFFTTKAAAEGTGLGLYVCRSLMDQIGGSIAIESEPGRGTVVTLRLPINLVSDVGTAMEVAPETSGEHR